MIEILKGRTSPLSPLLEILELPEGRPWCLRCFSRFPHFLCSCCPVLSLLSATVEVQPFFTIVIGCIIPQSGDNGDGRPIIIFIVFLISIIFESGDNGDGGPFIISSISMISKRKDSDDGRIPVIGIFPIMQMLAMTIPLQSLLPTLSPIIETMVMAVPSLPHYLQ